MTKQRPRPRRRVRRVIVDQVLAIRYQLEEVRCGKNCGGCPHGPYWYAYYQLPNGRPVSRYIGRTLDRLSAEQLAAERYLITAPARGRSDLAQVRDLAKRAGFAAGSSELAGLLSGESNHKKRLVRIAEILLSQHHGAPPVDMRRRPVRRKKR